MLTVANDYATIRLNDYPLRIAKSASLSAIVTRQANYPTTKCKMQNADNGRWTVNPDYLTI